MPIPASAVCYPVDKVPAVRADLVSSSQPAGSKIRALQGLDSKDEVSESTRPVTLRNMKAGHLHDVVAVLEDLI